MAKLLAPIVDGRKKIRLADIPTDATGGLKKEEGLAQLDKLGAELAELTNLLAYAGQHSLLIVFQGRDASGKDGAIRKVLGFANVLAAHVHPFKVPTEEERAHDFLWRVHKACPGKGQIALFNRSHYEDVIAVRVHELVPKDVWQGRFQQINEFEDLLIESGTILVKFILHVSADEQVKRLLEREEDPRTAWKLNVNDWREIPLWDETSKAYDDILRECASAERPFHVVPADHKWYRNLAVMERLVLALRPYRNGWLESLKDVRKTALKDIAAVRATLPRIKKIEKAVKGR
jgi:PPK2 family polyphosphate:nucleotide phosphotransferase